MCYCSEAFWESSCRIFPVIRSQPGAFLGWILYFMTFMTSLIRIFFIGRAIWFGAFSSFLKVSSSIADSWDGNGWKTDVRCSAKAVAFCLSLLAQVLRFVRIGGIWS